MLLFYLNMIESDEDRSAVARLFEAHQKPLLYIAQRVLKDPDTAEDMVQKAFVWFIKYRLADLKKSTNEELGRLLKKKVFSLSLNHLRDEKTHKEILEEHFVEPLPIREDFYKNIDTEIIKEALRSLPEQFQVVLALRIYYEMPMKEIAATLNISKSAADMRLSRARKALSEELIKEGILC